MMHEIRLNGRLSPSRPRRAGGFTIVELLVVIVVVGILAVVALAQYDESQKRARDSRRVTDVSTVDSAIQLFASSHNGAFPGSATWYFSPWSMLDGAIKCPAKYSASDWSNHNNCANADDPSFYDDIVGKGAYMAALPVDPVGDHEGGSPNSLGDGYPTDSGFVYGKSQDAAGKWHYTVGTNLENPTAANNAGGNYLLSR